jgi:hypothetical protein
MRVMLLAVFGGAFIFAERTLASALVILGIHCVLDYLHM